MSDAKTEAVRDATMSQTIGSSIDKPVSIERCEDGRVAVLGKFVGRVCCGSLDTESLWLGPCLEAGPWILQQSLVEMPRGLDPVFLLV